MIDYEMTDITRNGLVVPGGWKAFVLQVHAVEEDYDFTVRQLISALALQPKEAMRDALEIVQDRYTFGYTHGLRQSIMYHAGYYAERYPDLVVERDDGYRELAGFDPEALQGYYIPTIGAGKPSGAKDAMADMAKRTRQRRRLEL